MHDRHRTAPRRRTKLRGAAIVSAALVALAAAGTADAELERSAAQSTGAYAGLFAGHGRSGNRITDIDGFANWGNAGWTVGYDDEGFVGGALAGKRFAIDGRRFRIEADVTTGSRSAMTNRVDPGALDETAVSELRWMVTARVGVEEGIGPATVFATGGFAAARIVDSVTDIDFGPGMPDRVDPDDSFSVGTTKFGWVIGVGVETPLSDVLTLRVDGSYADFGRSTHFVNHSGDGRCGPGNPRRPCPYGVENRFSVARLAVIYRFGG